MTTRRPIRLAFWMPKGGVGKTTDTLLLSLLLARKGNRVLAIDGDPEAGLSRDMLGPALHKLPGNLHTYLEAGLPMPPPTLPTGVDDLSLLPCAPGQHRFFRLFPEHSPLLREGLDLIADDYDFILLDLANQFDNIAQLGLAAVDYLILPVELTTDCVERIDMALAIVTEARATNPGLMILGALPLASRPIPGHPLGLSAKELVIHREYEQSLARHNLRLFSTVMYRSAASVEDARSNFNDRLLHWTARRRFHRLLQEIMSRVASSSLSHSRHVRLPHHPRQARAAAAAAA